MRRGAAFEKIKIGDTGSSPEPGMGFVHLFLAIPVIRNFYEEATSRELALRLHFRKINNGICDYFTTGEQRNGYIKTLRADHTLRKRKAQPSTVAS